MIPALGCLLAGAALAGDPPPPPWTASLSASGMLNQGNLNQLQLTIRGQLHVARGRATSDTQLTAYRLWQRPAGAPAYISLGDDFALSETAGAFVAQGLQINGLARVETSQLNQLDLRTLLGSGVAWVPVRAADRQVRVLVGGLLEHARYPGDTFRIDVAHTAGRRTLGRVALLADGRFDPHGSSLSARYTCLYTLDPGAPRDFRVLLDGAVDVRAWGPLGFQVAASYTYSSVVLAGVDPHDLQVTLGLSLRGSGERRPTPTDADAPERPIDKL